MALNFKPQSHTIKFTGGDITVRGLTFPDISILVNAHRDKATELYERMAGIRQQDMITANDAGTIAMELVTTVPALVAHIIAMAADVPERFEDVLHLPPDVQAEALERITHLTFAMEGGAKNFIETVTRIATGANRLVDDLKAPQN